MTTLGDPLSAGIVIIRETDAGRRYLLLRAWNHWDFPKGKVEEGETPLEAAIREVEEETTITELDFHWGEQYRETGPYNRGKIARYYLARTATEKVDLPVVPELGCPEHNEYRWVTLEEAWDLSSPRVRQILRWVARETGDRLPRSARRGPGRRPRRGPRRPRKPDTPESG
ncbi:8-oxo-dGTP pyrophosphatase MutT (NUDIX family) [Natronospira proteinivora]|uniref:8-oxo-dGTP pyrophosphatase MutT (NUDIX family) n=1 Tax=Natronospira proteinivora TaxID=1807133 RepID=A0ABT1GDG5_9GAMM|nr:NUDIX domain-containing protein [Natronospira proteinivora]MCP1727987.1 8-oxo-dGTP pyrophosphatase MutT (NUDIX family) [Natronospira proteinivora]